MPDIRFMDRQAGHIEWSCDGMPILSGWSIVASYPAINRIVVDASTNYSRSWLRDRNDILL